MGMGMGTGSATGKCICNEHCARHGDAERELERAQDEVGGHRAEDEAGEPGEVQCKAGAARRDDRDAAREAVGRVHRDGSNAVFAEVLLHFQNHLLPVGFGYFERVQYGGNPGAFALETHVHDRPDYLRNLTFIDCRCRNHLHVL